MDNKPEQERGMILYRFCIDPIEVGIKAGILEEWILDVEDYEDLVERYEKGYEVVRKYADDVENLESLINMDDRPGSVFRWFRGEHYQVVTDGSDKKIVEGPAEKERLVFKEELEKLIDSDENVIPVLYKLMDRSRDGGAHEDDTSFAWFTMENDRIKYASSGTRYKIYQKDASKSMSISIFEERWMQDPERLEQVEGFYSFIDEYPDESMGQVYKLMVARELLPLVKEVLRGREYPREGIKEEIVELEEQEFARLAEGVENMDLRTHLSRLLGRGL